MMKSDESSLTVGSDGPILLQDVRLIEKLTRFNRERIPERVIHAKGAGAHGFFRVYMPMSDYTSAAFLQNPDKKVPVFVRFSTMTGSRGSADTARDPRGFAVKFYTSEGNYDLVASSLPVFFVRDAMKLPELIHSLKPAPDTNLIQAERFWKFVSENPETTHMITWLFSDRGTVKSYRHIEGNSVNTYVWVNKKGKRHFIRYHWKPLLGLKDINRQESEFLAGFDPDVATRDLYDSMERGETTDFELSVQLIPYEDQYQYDFDILDATKIWPESQIPLTKVGKMTINKRPENFFEEVEQAAFSPANIVPGIEFSFDRLLQGSIFASIDSQRYRLGVDYNQLPINKAKFAVQTAAVSSYPPTSVIIEGKVERKAVSNPDNFSQAGERYRSLNKREQDHLVDNIIDNMLFVDGRIQEKVVSYFFKADTDFGNRISRGLDY
ncbi:catalase [Sinanaerobacter chloroacetimidivorans]|jgi:catalase|uniref:catalase n=1 Tax=Sinanaerobacter chloroacetimidivorans TaxID=2818044 RepID=A0A8J8B0L0_9FIRM|nr:catalase [Sinanaerobacter chloroacetimidivorans]MBR0596741.1 catalase [Sinanaerobacter chloroacetimidivorans]